MSNDIAAILRKAKGLIANEKHFSWTHDFWVTTIPKIKKIPKWGILGAVAEVNRGWWLDASAFLKRAVNTEWPMPLWARDKSHGDILAAFDRAIELAESE